MNTVDKLGRRFKRKNPQYNHLSDVEAGRKAKEIYPGHYDNFIDLEEAGNALVQLFSSEPSNGLSSFQPDSLSHLPQIDYRKHQHDLEKTVRELNQYYNPNLGRLRSWNRRRKAESRFKLSEAITKETRSVLERGALLEEVALRSERGRLEFQKFVAEHTVELLELKSQAYRIEEGINKGVDSTTVNEINRTKYLNETSLEYQARIAAIEVERERQISEIKLIDYESKKKIDNDAEREQHSINQDNISRIQQETQELLDRSSKRIERMYDELAVLEASTDSAKINKIARKKKDIQAAEDELDARQAKFVQNATGEKSGGYNTDADSFGSDTEESEADVQ